ncbi:MAG: hypothetical protein IT168_30535 [Bryobacterales bacterium]|nr:hypothetical protein [Bryobacterales bacterium]
MVTSTHKPYIALALGDVMRGTAQKTQATETASDESTGFSAALNSALGDGVERFYVDGTPEGQKSGGVTENGQGSAASTDSSTEAAGIGDAPDRLPLIGSDTRNRKYTDYADPTPMIQEELKKLGVSADGLQFQRWDDEIANWGGHYTNHLLRVTAGGRTEDFSIELALRSPRVAAVEIRNLMNGGVQVS